MNTSQALLVYLVIVIFLFAIFIHLYIKLASALILTLLIGQILLNILCPPSEITPWSPDGESITSSVAIYVVIQILTPIAALVYIFVNAWYDRVKF